MFLLPRQTLVSLVATVLLLSASIGVTASASASDFEVWLMDQSDTNGGAFGGTIYIYDGNDLIGETAESAMPTDVLDLAGATSTLCMESTGANPVRPHMMFFNSTHSHAVVSFVASGHIVIFDAETRAPKACFRSSVGADDAMQAHAATPAPDDSFILIANQNGKLLERIDTDFETETFTANTEATLNLATCVTPSGAACEDPELRPDNAPIVPVIDSTSTLGFITLRGGGLFVVDPKTTPMQILGEYDNTTVHGNGFAGAEAAGTMFVNSGGGTSMNLGQFDVYAFPLTGYSAGNAPNTPTPELLFSADTDDRDSHGMVLTTDGRYLWVIDRIQNVAEVFDTETRERVNTVDLKLGGPEGLAPDLADVSPSGNHLFFSLADPIRSAVTRMRRRAALPGLGVIKVSELGAQGTLESVVPITNVDAEGIERADVHGIRVRLT